jgi:flagellar motor switch/type III secretory pathway protein FliN
MMEAIRFGWLGDSRRAAVVSRLEDVAAGWAADWLIGYAKGEQGIEPLAEWSLEAGASMPFVSRSESGLVAAYLRGRSPASLGRHLAAVVTDEEGGVAQDIGESALNDLATRIHRLAGAAANDAMHSAALSVAETRASSGVFQASLSLGRMSLDILLDRDICARLVPPTKQALPRMVRRETAVDRASVRLVASLDFGEVNLSELANLRVGEVLMSDRLLEDTLDIFVEGKGRVAQARLRRAGTHRAVTFGGEVSRDVEKS